MIHTYLVYATAKKEFDVEAELQGFGVDVWCGRLMEFKRSGKKRAAEAVEKPKLPNYLFLSITAEKWHKVQAKRIKHLASTHHILRRDDERELQRFKKDVEANLEKGRKIAENGDKAQIAEYKVGQKLIDINGRFGEGLLTFRRVVERAHQLYPIIQAETEMMGRAAIVELDPLDVRSA